MLLHRRFLPPETADPHGRPNLYKRERDESSLCMLEKQVGGDFYFTSSIFAFEQKNKGVKKTRYPNKRREWLIYQAK
jgi:hypothetical protein